MKSTGLVALCVCGLLAGASASRSLAQLDLPGGPSTVAEAAAATAETAVLAAAADAAGLTGALSGEGPYTVFAPTNDAFAAAVASLDITLDDLLDDTDKLTDILLYHVVPGSYQSSDLEDGQELTTLQGEKLTVSVNGDEVFINGAFISGLVVAADVEAGNGVVHVINAVLLPPAQPFEGPATVVDVAVATPETSTLVAAVTAADLAGALSGEGPFTVFAPTNDAFAAALAALNLTAEELLADAATLTDVLLYHVVPGSYLSSDLKDGQELTTLQGQKLTVSVNTDGVFINGAAVVAADVLAGNGVVHVINAVLLPPAQPAEPATVVDVAIATPETSTLVAAVTAADLAGALSTPGPFTVFAPTDDAFAAALAALNLTAEELLADTVMLTDILSYHVVPGLYLSSDLKDGQELTTLQGQPLTVSVNGDGVFINGAAVVAADAKAGNGVVHVINAVLLPPAMTGVPTRWPVTTVVDVAVNTPATSTLVAAVAAADLAGALSTEGPFTVFAPTNDAFAAALAALNRTAVDLLADTATLTDVLLYHVVPGFYLSSDLKDGQDLTTLQGQPLTVSVNGDGVMINGAAVVAADVMAGNGVVHVINAVLVPSGAPGAPGMMGPSDDSSSGAMFLSAAAACACLLLSVLA